MIDPVEILRGLGAEYSPDFDAYCNGERDPAKLRCVLCTKAPCECRQCESTYENVYYLATGRPQFEVCGMTIQPNGECPRGHRATEGNK